MLLALAIFFALTWLAAFLVFHVSTPGPHVFVVLAFVSLLVHIHRMGHRNS